MKNFFTVFKFEFNNYLKNKIFIGVTLILVLLITAVMFYPRIKALAQGGPSAEKQMSESPEDEEKGEHPVMLLSFGEEMASEVSSETEVFAESLKAAFPDFSVELRDLNEAALEKEILEGRAECALLFRNANDYTYLVGSLKMFDRSSDTIRAVVSGQWQYASLIAEGLSPEDASRILSPQIHAQVKNLGKDQMQNFFYTYVMIFALYMSILMYSQLIANSVASEKNSRAMELLVTSVKPKAMMFGKVIASCLAGLLQLGVIFGSAALFYRLNEDYWKNQEVVRSIFNMPPDLLLYMLLFFVLGFFIYAFLFGAVGSTVSKMEDVSTAILPVLMLFVFSFIIVMISLASGNTDNLLIRISSFVPFTSPMAMFTRIAMTEVPPAEIVISVAILLLSVILTGMLSAKIYRAGVLLYGTKPKLKNILKTVKEE